MASSRLSQLNEHITKRDAAAVKRALQLLPGVVHAKQSKDGRTPLHVAAAVGCLPSARELLTAGASCTAADASGDTPLHVAASQGHLTLVKELTGDAGRRCCLKSLNHNGSTPLHLAVAAGHAAVAQHLISAGAKLQARDKAGRTPVDLMDPEDSAMHACLANAKGFANIAAAANHAGPAAGGPEAHPPRSNSRRSLCTASPASLVSPTGSKRGTPAASAKRSNAKPPQEPKAGDGEAPVAFDASNPFLQPPADEGNHQAAAAAAAHVELDAAPHSDQHLEGDQNPFRDAAPATAGSSRAPTPAAAHLAPVQLLREDSTYSSLPDAPLSPTKRAQLAAAVAYGASGSAGGPNHYPHQQQQLLTAAALEQHHRGVVPPGPASTAGGSTVGGARSLHREAAPVLPPAQKPPVLQRSPWDDLSTRVSQCGLRAKAARLLAVEGSYGALQLQEMQQPLTAGSSSLRVTRSHPAADAAAGRGGPLASSQSCYYPAGGPGSSSARGDTIAPALQQQSSYTTSGNGSGSGGLRRSSLNPYSIYKEPMPLREMSAKILELEAAAAGLVASASRWDATTEALPETNRSIEACQQRVTGAETLVVQLEEGVVGLKGRLEATEGRLAALKERHEDHTQRMDGLQLSLLQRLALVGSEQQNLWGGLNQIKEELAEVQEQQAATAAATAAASSAVPATATAVVAAPRSPSPAVGAGGGVRGAALGMEVAAAVAAAVRPLQEQLAGLRAEVDVLMSGSKSKSAEAALLRSSLASFTSAAPAAGAAAAGGAGAIMISSPAAEGPAAAAAAGGGGGGGGGGIDESLVAFMDTTSRCLMDQENTLVAVQSSSEAAERRLGAQVEELRQEVAVVQTALGMLGNSLGATGSSNGPLGSALSLTSQMSMATNMVKLQGHMGALEASFAALQAQAEEAAQEHASMQAAWRQEASRQEAAAAAAADRAAEQAAEMEAREERLSQLRMAVLAEEAARRELLDLEAGVGERLRVMQAGQGALERDVEGLKEQAANLNEIFMGELHQINDKVEEVASRLDAATEQVMQHMAAPAAAIAAAATTAPASAPAAQEGLHNGVTSVTSVTAMGDSVGVTQGEVLLPGRSQLSCALSSGPSSETGGVLSRPESAEGVLRLQEAEAAGGTALTETVSLDVRVQRAGAGDQGQAVVTRTGDTVGDTGAPHQQGVLGRSPSPQGMQECDLGGEQRDAGQGKAAARAASKVDKKKAAKAASSGKRGVGRKEAGAAEEEEALMAGGGGARRAEQVPMCGCVVM